MTSANGLQSRLVGYASEMPIHPVILFTLAIVLLPLTVAVLIVARFSPGVRKWLERMTGAPWA